MSNLATNLGKRIRLDFVPCRDGVRTCVDIAPCAEPGIVPPMHPRFAHNVSAALLVTMAQVFREEFPAAPAPAAAMMSKMATYFFFLGMQKELEALVRDFNPRYRDAVAAIGNGNAAPLAEFPGVLPGVGLDLASLQRGQDEGARGKKGKKRERRAAKTREAPRRSGRLKISVGGVRK